MVFEVREKLYAIFDNKKKPLYETIKIIMEKMRFYQTSKIAVIQRIAKITIDFDRNYLTRNFIQFGVSAP